MFTFRPTEFQRFDDLLHDASSALEDISWGPFWLRCIEFHFGRGIYLAGDHFGWHVHKELQLELVLSGEFQFTVRGGPPVKVVAGEVFVVPPDTVHRWKCTKSGMLIGVLLAKNLHSDSSGVDLSTEIQASVASGAVPAELRDAFLSGISCKVENRSIVERRVAAYAYLLIDSILNDCVGVPSVPRSVSDEGLSRTRGERVVSTLIRFIDANITGSLTMDRLERCVPLSGRQLQRLFSQTTGTSCHKYIMNRRLEIAREKLTADPTLSIKEVAYSCGFLSPAHFSTNFKRMFGVSPSDFSP